MASVSPALRWRITCLGSAGVFVALALLAGFGGLLPGEELLYGAIIGWVSPAGVAILRIVRYLGRWQFLLPATLLLIWVTPAEARRRWWLWAAVMIVAPLAEGAGKEIIARPRPGGQALGFPSGHVTAAAAYFSLFAYLMSQRLKDRALLLWVVVWIPVALVGIARIVQRAHWPADVLGGVALGLAFASAAFWWHEQHIQGSPVRRPYIVLVALAVVLPLGVAAQGVTITIDAIEKGGHIDGMVTGFTEASRTAHKVVVYAKKDTWYIHPYAGGGNGKSWSSISQNGSWRVETVRRDAAASALAALVVKKESVVPAQVADVRGIPHEAIIVRELEGTPDYDKL